MGAGLERPSDEIVKRLPPLQSSQTRRVGRGDVDGDEVAISRKRRDADGIIAGAIGRELVGPDIHPDEAGGFRASRQASSRSPRRPRYSAHNG